MNSFEIVWYRIERVTKWTEYFLEKKKIYIYVCVCVNIYTQIYMDSKSQETIFYLENVKNNYIPFFLYW